MASKILKKYSKSLLGMVLVIVISFLLPVLFLQNFGTLKVDSFVILSLFSSLFGIPLMIIGDMFYTKIYKGRFVEVISKDNVIGKVIEKKIIKDKFTTPLVLAPISLPLFFAATALEKDDTYYQLSVIVNEVHRAVYVKEDEYEKIKISDLIGLKKINKQEIIHLSWLEMIALGIFRNQEIENFSVFKLNN
jgi:hypothetical protein